MAANAIQHVASIDLVAILIVHGPALLKLVRESVPGDQIASQANSIATMDSAITRNGAIL